LADLDFARRIARRTRAVVKQNIAWAALYNLLSVPLALSGYLPPWAAGLGMALSSLLVIGNALRLGRAD
jgi:Cu2+-exporting ATPase